MATGFQLSDGGDIDGRFAPWQSGMNVHPNIGFQRIDAVDVARLFAPLNYGSAGHAVGFQLSDGRDMYQVFAWINSTVQTPGFNGGTYSEQVQGVTGGGPQYVEAYTQLVIDGNGTWRAVGGNSFKAQQTYQSGSLYYGGPSGWEYRMTGSNGYDTGWVPATQTSACPCLVSVRNTGSDYDQQVINVNYQARRQGTTDVVINANCTLTATAQGNQPT